MSDPSGVPLDAAARYLATGDPTGLPADGTRHRLDRALALLAERTTWAQPSPGLFDAITDQVERIVWDRHLERLGPVGRIEPVEQTEGVVRVVTSAGPDEVRPRCRPARHLEPRSARRTRKTRRTRELRRPTTLLVGTAAAVVAIVGAVVTGAVRAWSPGMDGREVALVGTDLAPGASGEATLCATPSGVAVTLHVEGLDPAPRRSYYQAWVKGPRGSVAIGTFHVRAGDDEPIELWSGVDDAAYPELTVTLEPEDGNPASSGRKVLGSAPAPGAQSDQRTGTSGSGT